MTRVAVDASLTTQPCCFYAEPDSRTFPKLQVDKVDKEQPCTEVLPMNYIPESLAMGFIAAGACALQRKFGVCPRGLGPEVDPRLLPMNQRK